MAVSFFYSIEHPRTTTIKIKRSTFICSMEYAGSIETAKKIILQISKQNKSATHNCWAYIIGEKADTFHCSDGKEPSGTAGKPILNTLQKHCMTNIAVVVTRYFGGVKLGIKGLIKAYSASVENTIEIKKLKKIVKTIDLLIDVSYEFNDTLLDRIKSFSGRIKDTAYTEKIVHTYEVEFKDYAKADRLLSEYQSQGRLKFYKKTDPY